MDIAEYLAGLEAEDNLRRLPDVECSGKYLLSGGKRYLNFSSNDYLGISASGMHRDFMRKMTESGEFLLSNPSSRLITGNSHDYARLEQAIVDLYGGSRVTLVLGSGYLANSGVLPAVTSKGDLILVDKFVHASIIDGLRLCEAEWARYAHNDMDHLETLLRKAAGKYDTVWVATESVFSMDGDKAPLRELVELKQKYGFKIYIDEAHAFGVCGRNGRSLGSEVIINNKGETAEAYCDIIIATLGKAIASQGAFVLTDLETRELLVNRMRTLIFSTALPPISLRWSEYVISRLPEMEPQRAHLRELISICGGETHIIPVMAGENSRAVEMAGRFREAGFWVMPVRYPTVPKGAARVRVSLSAALTTEDAENFISESV